MNTSNLVKVVEAIAADILALAQEVLRDNSLQDSHLYKNMSVQVDSGYEPVVVSLLLDNYAEYLEKGRKPATGKKPPIDALREWALARNIPADNPTLWAISTAIQRDGYEARPILAALEQQVETYFEREWADKLFDALTEGLMKYFD